ncbi:MAG TPA: hypothetical protein VFP43_13120 [Mesorhizobium sp.]|nr:hypothetical protein [Mesorhizobium sp.]
MRSAVSLIAIAIFAVGFVWQYGGWLLEWIGRFIGTRGLSSSYDAFANSFVAPLLAEGSIVRIIGPWILMGAGLTLRCSASSTQKTS